MTVAGHSLDKLQFEARLEPSSEKAPDGVSQIGDLFVCVPLPSEQSRDLAFSVATGIAERIAFSSGDFRLRFGYVVCRRIGETPDEIAQIGDKAYSAEISLVEVVEAPEFASTQLAATPADGHSLALMSQFNTARREHSPAAQFLGFVRILESVFSQPKDRRKLLARFLQSERLRELYDELVESGDFESAMDNIVYCRDRCAHLKLKDGVWLRSHGPGTCERRPAPSAIG